MKITEPEVFEEVNIIKKYLSLIILASVTQWGCEFIGGAAVGLEEDYKNERISRREYETRKSQIESGSIIY